MGVGAVIFFHFSFIFLSVKKNMEGGGSKHLPTIPTLLQTQMPPPFPPPPPPSSFSGYTLVDRNHFTKLLAKGKGEDKEEANRQLSQVVKRGPRKKQEELHVKTVEVEEMEVEEEVGL